MNLWSQGIKLFKKYQSVIYYIGFGGFTTVINIGVFQLFTNVVPLNYQVANVIAWFISVLFAYITNKIWVFASHTHGLQENLREIGSFFFFRTLTLLMDVIILFVGIQLLHGNSLLVKVIDNVLVILANYFFSKWYIFKSTN